MIKISFSINMKDRSQKRKTNTAYAKTDTEDILFGFT